MALLFALSSGALKAAFALLLAMYAELLTQPSSQNPRGKWVRQCTNVVLQALQQNLSGNEIMGEIVVAAGKYDLDDGTVKVLHQLAA